MQRLQLLKIAFENLLSYFLLNSHVFYLFFSVVSANQTEMSSDNSLCDDEVAYTPEYQPYTELN